MGFYPHAALAKRRGNAELPSISSDSATTTEALTLPLALDPDLTRLIDAWPILPDAIRAAMLALLQSAVDASRKAPRTPGNTKML